MLNIDLKNQIKEYAKENSGQEVCGLILVSGNSNFIYKCRNISQNKEKHFEISSLDYLRAWDNGNNKIVGFFHSQKSPKPSMLDVINRSNHNIPSYLYSFEIDDVIEVTEQHFKYEKYLGIPFKLGENDCFSLVRNFYWKEKNILIHDYFRKEGWFEENNNLIQDNYSKENFIIINNNESIKEDDIIEFNFRHLGIYLEGDLLLHHPRCKYSTIEKFDMSFKNRISNVYRYGK